MYMTVYVSHSVYDIPLYVHYRDIIPLYTYIYNLPLLVLKARRLSGSAFCWD